MKCHGILITFLVIPSITFAQAGSIPPPFRSPFLIKIQVNEMVADTEWSNFTGSPLRLKPDTVLDSMMAYPFDTTLSGYSGGSPPDSNLVYISSDTIEVTRKRLVADLDADSQNVRIVLDPGRPGVIKALRYSFLTSGARTAQWNVNQGVTLFDLRYDSTGIWPIDTSYSRCVSNVWDSGSNIDNIEFGGFFWLVSVSSIDLSGIFHPTHRKNFSSVGTSPTKVLPISIQALNGALFFQFGSSADARDLTLYTPLGVRAASYEIPPGQSEIAIPGLPSGLYFVRMEGTLLKVAVP